MRTLILCFGLLGAAYAQVSSSALVGEVHDPASAAVRGAVVTATHVPTGFARSVLTSGEGTYRIGDLFPGEYTVTASKPGFQTAVARRVLLEVNRTATLDFALTLGAERDTVTVTGMVSSVAAEDASAGFRLASPVISALPLGVRNPVSLITLGPGAIPRQLGGFVHDVINDVQEGSRGAVGLNPAVNGLRSTMNAFLLDGAYDTDRNTFAISVIPPMEAVQEFRTTTALAPAEFAQAGGGVMDVVTKSGSQSWHGSALEFFRNEATDARNYFEDPSLPRSIFRQNQFGGSLGGPLPLPSTFVFGTYEGLRGKSAMPALSLIPDPVLRGGDFSGRNPIFDPLAVDKLTGTRLPFPGNVIPENRIDPIARKYLDTYEPLPNRAGSSGNYVDNTPNEAGTDAVLVRVDHQFRDRSLLFTRYTLNRDRNRIAGAFPVLPTAERVRAQQAALGYTTAGAAWLNEARLSFTRLRVFNLPESAFKTDVARELGVTNQPSDPFTFGLPYFLVTNFSTVTDSPTLPQTQRDNTWQAADAVSLVRGRMTWKAGLDWIHYQLNYRQSRLARGQYIFTGAFTGQPGSSGQTGDAFADFLLGFPQSTNRSVGPTQAYMRQNSWSGYAQNEWRAGRRITLNLGLRYEYASPYTEARGNLLNLDYSALPAPPRLAQVNTAVKPDRNNFAPRVGLAVRLPGGAALRAGYGIYYSQEIAVETYDLILNGVRNEMNQTDGGRLPLLTLANGFPRTASTGFPSYFGLDPNARTPYAQQWSAGIQRELAGHILAEIAYIGTKGAKLGRFRQFNTPLHVVTGENLAPRPGDLQSLRPFPELGQIIQRQNIANSSYHSLQFRAEKRLARGLGFLASFVWSKSIDDADSVVPGQFDSFGAQDERNLRLERGLSFFNVGRRVSAGFVYSLPGKWMRPVLSGWEVSGIVTLQDGTPLNPVYFAFDPANTGTPNRPNIVPGQSIVLPRSQRTADHFFNTDAFSTPAPYTFGNAGRNIIPGPGNNVFDLALHRRFRVAEAATIELRGEALNAFNHPNWGIPGPYPDFGPFFGKVFSTGEPRRFQFGARLDF